MSTISVVPAERQVSKDDCYHTVVLFVRAEDAEHTFAVKGYQALAGMIESVCRSLGVGYSKIKQIEKDIEKVSENLSEEVTIGSYNLMEGINLLIEYNELPPGLTEK
jgi:hypothetical protein